MAIKSVGVSQVFVCHFYTPEIWR